MYRFDDMTILEVSWKETWWEICPRICFLRRKRRNKAHDAMIPAQLGCIFFIEIPFVHTPLLRHFPTRFVGNSYFVMQPGSNRLPYQSTP